MHLSVEFHPAHRPDEHTFSFAPDAFFLPAEGWSPQLLPARGAFATGGVPPPTWLLTLACPRRFSGSRKRAQTQSFSRSGGEQTLRIVQQAKDGYPFVIAGRYTAAHFNEPAGNHKSLESHSPGCERASPTCRRARYCQPRLRCDVRYAQPARVASTLARGMSRRRRLLQWHRPPTMRNSFPKPGAKPSAEMASLDTVMVDLRSGAPEIVAAAGSFAGFELARLRPESRLLRTGPAALRVARIRRVARAAKPYREPQVRTETIRRALALVPRSRRCRANPKTTASSAPRVFYSFSGCRIATARTSSTKPSATCCMRASGGGFDLDDLIAAFEQETHQNVAEFVRHWMKRPGVPEDFRARYETTAGANASNPKETSP